MAEILSPSVRNIERAAQALKNGFLIGLPTETVYGLAGDSENKNAVKKIYEVKGRPSNHPVIVHIGSPEYLAEWARDIPDYAIQLAHKFWPGPMTLILKRTELAKDFITGNQDSVGIRIPNHQIALSILEQFNRLGGSGLVAPSANKFEAVSPTDANAVLSELGAELDQSHDLIIDGGISEVGLESTIINCLNEKPRIMRQGAITKLDIEDCIGSSIFTNQTNSTIQFSGNKSRHYAPKTKILLNEIPNYGDGYLALSSFVTPLGCIRLASPKSSIEFAKVLYSSFRKADLLGLRRLIVIPPQGNGIELAILERLEKASR